MVTCSTLSWACLLRFLDDPVLLEPADPMIVETSVMGSHTPLSYVDMVHLHIDTEDESTGYIDTFNDETVTNEA